MLRIVIIILLSLSAVLPSMAGKADSLIVHILSSQKLPDYHALRYCSYMRYDKTQVSLHDVSAFSVDNKLMRKHKWLRAILEATGASDSIILPIMTDQRVTHVYWRSSPARERQVVLGINREGLNEIFDTGDLIDMFASKKFPDLSFYDDTLIIDGEKKITPIGINSALYYDYVMVEQNDSTMRICFTPKPGMGQDMSGFITLVKEGVWNNDSIMCMPREWKIRRTEFLIEKSPEEKHIDRISICQNYVTTPKGYTALRSTDFLVELRKWGMMGNAQYRKTQIYSDFSADSIPDKKFRHHSKLSYSSKTDFRGPDFWRKYDADLAQELTDYHTMDSLHYYRTTADTTGVVRRRQSVVQEYLCDGFDYLGTLHKGLKLLAFPAKAFVNDYIEVGKTPVFDIEPVYSIFSFNDVDKFRMRMGGTTTANLFKRVFFGGYLAYGFGSKNVYYDASALYSFNDKVYEPHEFPQRNISIESRNDICYLGERAEHKNHDNLFKSFHWDKYTRMMYYNMQKVEAEWDMQSGIGFVTSLKREKDSAIGDLLFHSLHELSDLVETALAEGTYPYATGGSVTATELRMEMLYIPPSQRYYSRKSQMPINTELPSISLSHTIGIKFLGGDYSFHLSELNIMKKWYLGALGTAKTILKAGYLWSAVPYPLLLTPPTNISYISEEGSFNLVKPSGFVNDRYVQLLMSMEMNGNLIGKIPFIKRLRWREYLAVRMMWGALSDKNNPTLPQNFDSNILMPLPENVAIMDGNVPYIEGAIGIHRILGIFNVEYIHRFTYRNLPDAQCNGFRFSVQFDL